MTVDAVAASRVADADPKGVDGNAGRTRCLVLVARRISIAITDHVQAMLDLAVQIHLVTLASDRNIADPRFASVAELPATATHADFVATAVAVGRKQVASAVITFSEVDIEIAEAANRQLGNEWAAFEAASVSRDKLRQRRFLREHGIPSVRFVAVRDVDTALAAARDIGLPLILKPTRATSSDYVELITDPERFAPALSQIRKMIAEKRRLYYEDVGDAWAICEEYLPGQEVTVDGIVLDGEFTLGGVHNKRHTTGPFFEEDLYTLPFSDPDREGELVQIIDCIVRKLDVKCCLFNAELREDAEGEYRVVEFSTRISGGHPYRHIKDVYAIDLVRMFVRAACGEPVAAIVAQENPRQGPRVAVCAKVIYASGRVVRNSVGDAIYSPYFRVYYPTARPGRDVVSGAQGIDFTGALSVWMPWRPGQSPAVIHAVAEDLAAQLDIEIVAEPNAAEQV